MIIAPIVIFSYDRPSHLQQTLDALSKNLLADQSDLFIYCDGAKESSPAEQIERIKENRKIAHAAKGFKSVSVIERPQNIGLKANIVGAVTEIVNQHSRVRTISLRLQVFFVL